MGVSFWVPEAPATEEVCPYCLDIRSGNLRGGVSRDGVLYCESLCRGVERVSTAPEFHRSNGTASHLLIAALGSKEEVNGDLAGRIPLADLPAVVRRLRGALELLPAAQGKSPDVAPAVWARIAGDIGLLIALCEWAQKNGYPVSYG